MDNKPTILLIDDEGPAVFAIQKHLTDAGFLVTTAFSAQEGLKTAIESHPDVIILDVMMPAESGLDILPELRADPWGKNAKVIIFGNLDDSEHKARTNKYNVNKYLIKADTPLKDLENIIRQILSKNSR